MRLFNFPQKRPTLKPFYSKRFVNNHMFFKNSDESNLSKATETKRVTNDKEITTLQTKEKN